jgi:signal transduction histidine kinase
VPPSAESRFGSLGWRIFLWTALLALGPLLIMSYQGYHCARQAIEASAGERLFALLEARQARLESLITGVRSDFELMAITPCTTGSCTGLGCGSTKPEPGSDSQSCCGFLDSLRERNPAYEQIVAYDGEWRSLNSTGGVGTLSRESLPQEFLRGLADSKETVITAVQLLPDGRLVAFAGRVYSGYGGPGAGYVIAWLDLTREVGLLLGERSGLGLTGRLLLVAPDGHRLFTAAGIETVDQHSPHIQLATLNRTDSHASRSMTHRGQEVLGASLNVPSFGWLLVAEIDHAEAFSWLRTLRARAIVTGVLTFLLVMFLARRVARKLSRPLAELAGVSRKIAGGEHGERVGSLEGSEAKEVGRAFNRMMDELEESHRRLTQAAALAAVGQLSSSIVHEMRNPLSSVKLNLQALRQWVRDEQPYAELSDIALDQAGRLERMLEDLLGFGKPLELHFEQVDLAVVAASVKEELRAAWDSKDISIVLGDLGGIDLRADPEQLHRVLANLMANAIQAVDRGGEVRLSASTSDAATLITVEDDGPGIDAGILDRLFLPFVSTRQDGTGLGLAYVKKIVELHGGTVSAENLPVGGACFTVSLPSLAK